MRATGPKAFWLSFFITLGVVLPLMGSFALWAVWQNKDAAPAQQPQSGVPVRTPGPEHCYSLLITVACEQPAFVLLRLDAVQNALTVEALPGQSVLLGQAGSVLLADSYAAAGPARAAELLAETLNIPIDRYLALTPEALCAALKDAGLVRLNLTGLLTEEEQAELGLAGPVQEYSPETAAEFLAGMDARLPPERAGALRAAIWEAFLRQNLETLPAALPNGLRSVSSRLLTNLTAADLYTLGQTLNFLAAGPAAAPLPQGETAEEDPQAAPAGDGALRITAGVLPGRWNPQSGRYEFSEETAALAARLFGAASPAASPAPTEPDAPVQGPEADAVPEDAEDAEDAVKPPAAGQPANTADPAASPAPAEPSAVSPAMG